LGFFYFSGQQFEAGFLQFFLKQDQLIYSAGIGRTCTFIAIAQGVQQLCETPEDINIFSIVSRLRMQRYGAVQLPEQYAFIYLALQRMERLLPECTAYTDTRATIFYEQSQFVDREAMLFFQASCELPQL
uniref:Tyrosine-protein phosphatase domain-containing protein n=1 Tax=Gongylonema pulchrum TaxID=637853 RepID=A0A183D8B0_9BILA